MWRRMEKVSLVDKFNNEEVLGRVNEDSLDRKLLNSFGKGNIDGLAMFWDTTDFCTKLLK